MGIPSYFSYILKKHCTLIKKLTFNVHNLYIDSNSIIYDALRNVNVCKDFEDHLIHAVCLKLDEYIQQTKPDNTVLIAFDGVAPVAKLEQQRNRRYKSRLEKHIFGEIEGDESGWDSTAITPGTAFMNTLGERINDYYRNREKDYGLKKIIVSTSDDIGEGEHKIFHYIRKNAEFHRKTTTLVYGPVSYTHLTLPTKRIV